MRIPLSMAPFITSLLDRYRRADWKAPKKPEKRKKRRKSTAAKPRRRDNRAIFNLKMTPEEHEILVRAAQADKQTMQRIVREALIESLHEMDVQGGVDATPWLVNGAETPPS